MQDHTDDQDPIAPRLDFALWRKILVFARPYRREMVLLAIVAILCACCDVVLPLLTGRIIDEIQLRGAEARVWTYGWLYLGTIAFLALNIYLFIILAGRVTTGVNHDIRRASFEKLQALPFSFYDRKAVGWLMARLTSDSANLSRIMGWALLDIVWGNFLLATLTIVMFVLSWRLALVVLLIVPPLLLVSKYFSKRILITSRLLRKANSHTTAGFNEAIVGVRTTKSLVREERNLHEFTDLTQTMYRHAVDNALYSALFLPLVLTICSLGVGLALWRGGMYYSLGMVSLGTLITFTQYAAYIQNPVQELANTLTMIQGAQASAERIQGLLDAPVEIEDSVEVVSRIAEFKRRGVKGEDAAEDGMPDRIESIEFRDVSFAYNQGQSVLDQFNLRVNAGETIALVGPTGGGKSTIVGLACRFYEPTSGEVLINGTDYRRRSLHWLQSSLGMVLQQPHLFSGSVRDNIRYGRLEATDEEVQRAAMTVNAHDFIDRLPEKYNTAVGEGGNRLSTGQKQLIALARAVIADPQIFVMDEATSSVDTQTERAIQSAIDRVLTGRISFIIAHRLSTIRSADRILFIAGGKIVEQGTHHELIRARGRYFELYTNQFTHERESELLHYTVEMEDIPAG